MATKGKVLVTGANGFVGTALVPALLDRGFRVRMTGQENPPALHALGAEFLPMEDLSGPVNWRPALDGVDAIVHLAAIAHRSAAGSTEAVEVYNQVNHLATRSLATCIAALPAPAPRLVFMSSARVHGEPEGMPIRRDSPLVPVTPYDVSKVEAEQAIGQILAPSQFSWAILRPVVMYGPGQKGNMARLESLIRNRIPIPVGRQPNRRSFLFLGNLVSAILAFLEADPPPSGKTWLLADKEPASTEGLARVLGRALRRRPGIVRLPAGLLRLSSGFGDILAAAGLPFPWTTETRHKLLDDYYVDISPIEHELRWSPPFRLEDAIDLTYSAR